MIRRLQVAVRELVAVSIAALVVSACSTTPPNGSFDVSVAASLQPRLSPADAVDITRAYLDAQGPQLAASNLHVDAHVQQVWAVRASAARELDACIPPQASDAIVWVTRGLGDYLNLTDYPWSHRTGSSMNPAALACQDPSTEGILVIDDRSGAILGVYPFVGPVPTP